MSILKHPFVVMIFLFTALATACSNPSDQPAAIEEHGEQKSHEESGELGGREAHEDEVVELSPEAASQVEIRTVAVEQRVLAAYLLTTGQVGFDQTRLAHVSPRISGRVHQVDVVLGQDVGIGQKLAEVDSIELGRAKAVYLQTKAKEDLAHKNFDRAQNLLADRIASKQEVLEAEAELREVTAGLHTAEETLHLYGLSQSQVDTLSYEDSEASIYSLRAPFAGTLVERHATLGELVTPERNLFTLADLSRVWIWIDVYQRDLGGVHIDDQARARVDAFPGEVFAGKVSYLSAQIDTDTRTLRARIDVANPEGKLRPGMFVEVELLDPHAQAPHSQDDAKPGLVVPEDAVMRDGEELFVFIVAGERRFERREVRIGRKSGGFAEVLEGIGADDSVVVEGAFLLKSAVSKESLGEGHEH